MFRRKNFPLPIFALCLTAAPSHSAAIPKRQRVVTNPTDLAIDEGLFTNWRGDQQKKNRNGIDLDAIERDLEERRWLKSGSYSYSEDSNPKRSAADSSNGSVIDFDTKISVADSGADSDSTGNSDYRSPETSADSKLDADEDEVRTETKSLLATVTVGCPSAGIFTTNNLVVYFAYMLKTKPESTVDIQAMYEKIKQKIFDSLASEIVDCSGESSKIIVAKMKGAGRNLEVMLADSYPEDQVVGTCDDVNACFIVQGAITVTYTENETKETATLYTMNKVKEKMNRGEFNNQGNVVSVEYIGNLSNIPKVKLMEPIEQENNKSSGVVIVLSICGLLFLTFGSIFVKFFYDMRGSKNEKYQVHHNESCFMDEDSDTVIDICVEDLP